MSIARVVSVSLPVPPSANACWRNGRGGKGRFRTDVYKAWAMEAAMIARAAWRDQGSPVIERGYQVIVRAGIDHKRDLDNLAKPIIDVLGPAMDLPNDRWCDRVELSREGSKGRVFVTVIGCAPERVGEVISIGDAANRVLAGLIVNFENDA